MNLILASLLLLCSQSYLVVQAAPCQSFKTQEQCEAGGKVAGEDVECSWCSELETCAEECGEVDPVAGPDDQPCPPLKSEAECNASGDCFWCSDNEACRSSEDECIADEDETEKDENKEEDEDDDTGNATCRALATEDDCAGVEICIWCPTKEICRSDSSGCPGGAGGVGEDEDGGKDEDEGKDEDDDTENATCRALATEEDCAGVEICIWCPDKETCRSESSGCPGADGDDDDDKGTSCPPQKTEDDCAAVESCTWCPETESCRLACSVGGGGNAGGGGGGGDGEGGSAGDRVNCNKLGDEAECLESETCFWCAGQEACRSGFAQCPGNDIVKEKPNLCGSLKNETGCLASGECFWCEDKSLCRRTEEECPGKGRENTCRDLLVDTCDSTEGCAWHEASERCSSERGFPGGTDDKTKTSDKCPPLLDEESCIGQNSCRWCEDTSSCQKASEKCEDGSLGKRGNPCREADSEDICGGVDGCLWCASSTKCVKATTTACSEDDTNDEEDSGGKGNTCRLQDAEPECSEIEDCKWCDAQSRCKKNEDVCEDPSGDVDLYLLDVRGGAFEILDDGLGPSDPNSVSVVLSYLYEITESGEVIQSSLVDLENQEYEVKQTIDTFFDGIEARRIRFESTIDGVGKIEMDVYIMLQSGTISTSGEVAPSRRMEEAWPVNVGDVKFNVELSNWTFCSDESPCGNSGGASSFVDLAFEIKGNSEEPDQSEESALLFNLGGNVPLLLSSAVEVDGSIQEMPEGFPRAESTENQGTIFVFRFPAFNETIAYDPIIPYHYSIPVLSDEVVLTDEVTDAPVPTKAPSVPTSPPPTASPTIPENAGDDDSLSGGAISGIVIGVLLGLCCCCAAFGAIQKKSESRHGDTSLDKNNTTVDEEIFVDEIGNVDEDDSGEDQEDESEEEGDSDGTEEEDDDDESESSSDDMA